VRNPETLIRAALFLLAIGCGAAQSQQPAPAPVQPPTSQPAGPEVIAPQGFGVLSANHAGKAWRVLDEQRAAKLLSVDVTSPPYRAEVPAGMAPSGRKLSVRLQLYVAEDGSVADVKPFRGSGDPTLAARWSQTVKTWRYRPFIEGGTAKAFATSVHLEAVAP
jgi:outer membrane biosynthesis protein TonB